MPRTVIYRNQRTTTDIKLENTILYIRISQVSNESGVCAGENGNVYQGVKKT